MRQQYSIDIMDKLKAELRELDEMMVEVEGKKLLPSQCYRFETNPTHVMFNTNCPDSLKAKVEAILAKYTGDESRS